jgi:hypothetical protein
MNGQRAWEAVGRSLLRPGLPGNATLNLHLRLSYPKWGPAIAPAGSPIGVATLRTGCQVRYSELGQGAQLWGGSADGGELGRRFGNAATSF